MHSLAVMRDKSESGGFEIENHRFIVWLTLLHPSLMLLRSSWISRMLFARALSALIRQSTGASLPRDCVLLHGHSSAVYSTCFLPSSPFLLSASADKTGL